MEWRLRACCSLPVSVWGKLLQQCDDDEERRNELISWWLQCSPYALDSWKWLSGQLLYCEEDSALAAAKRYIHQTPGMSVVNYRHACIHSVMYNQCCMIMVKAITSLAPIEKRTDVLHVCVFYITVLCYDNWDDF